VQVAEQAPRDWVVVTRDLWKEFGTMTLTGIAPTAMGGDAFFAGSNCSSRWKKKGNSTGLPRRGLDLFALATSARYTGCRSNRIFCCRRTFR
jgi:hypothetical protein